jgi:hypothetical protein
MAAVINDKSFLLYENKKPRSRLNRNGAFFMSSVNLTLHGTIRFFIRRHKIRLLLPLTTGASISHFSKFDLLQTLVIDGVVDKKSASSYPRFPIHFYQNRVLSFSKNLE